MGKEKGGIPEEDYHNIMTLSNAYRARRVYEEAHLLSPNAKRIKLKHQGEEIKADDTTITIFKGVENGVRTQLLESGWGHELIQDIYAEAERKVQNELGETK
jgi:hypothetical protein